mmetsp:Transcript_15738/g.22050  ORF Transcript_15738/g.22050 Transcript_15738/m.22050 type:complete len:854 (-) Transcript_15738:338-2899(-)
MDSDEDSDEEVYHDMVEAKSDHSGEFLAKPFDTAVHNVEREIRERLALEKKHEVARANPSPKPKSSLLGTDEKIKLAGMLERPFSFDNIEPEGIPKRGIDVPDSPLLVLPTNTLNRQMESDDESHKAKFSASPFSANKSLRSRIIAPISALTGSSQEENRVTDDVSNKPANEMLRSAPVNDLARPTQSLSNTSPLIGPSGCFKSLSPIHNVEDDCQASDVLQAAATPGPREWPVEGNRDWGTKRPRPDVRASFMPTPLSSTCPAAQLAQVRRNENHDSQGFRDGRMGTGATTHSTASHNTSSASSIDINEGETKVEDIKKEKRRRGSNSTSVVAMIRRFVGRSAPRKHAEKDAEKKDEKTEHEQENAFKGKDAESIDEKYSTTSSTKRPDWQWQEVQRKDAKGRHKRQHPGQGIVAVRQLACVPNRRPDRTALWSLKVSPDGNYIAVGGDGQDPTVRVYKIRRRAPEAALPAAGERRRPSTASLTSKSSAGTNTSAGQALGSDAERTEKGHLPLLPGPPKVQEGCSDHGLQPFSVKLYRQYSGHKADVVDLSWSPSGFLLTASIDRTVRLWHVRRERCLCVFRHQDFVTSVQFHPGDDRFFVSGSFDAKLRIWSIPKQRVVEWTNAPAVITAASFSPDGDFVVTGLHDGICVVYKTYGLMYVSQIVCKNRHGKHRSGRKVTGVEFSKNGAYVLITTNDSRIRLVSFDTLQMVSKFKGLSNCELQIKATFGPDDRFIISGSDLQSVHIWECPELPSTLSGASLGTAAGAPKKGGGKQHAKKRRRRKIRTDVACKSFRASSDAVTSAQFGSWNNVDYIVTTDLTGTIKFFRYTNDAAVLRDEEKEVEPTRPAPRR